MIADTCQVEEPHLVLRQLNVAAELAGRLKVIARRRVFVNIRRTPFIVGRQVTQRLLGSIEARFLLGGVKDGHAVEHAVRLVIRVFLSGVPDLSARIGFFQHRQQLGVPVLRVAPVWLRLDIVPPHELLAF
jgi:hypothetical protein